MASEGGTLASGPLIQDLYRLLLKRDPDPEGLEHFSEKSAGEVLEAILASQEYQDRISSPSDEQTPAARLAVRAASRLGRRPRVVDVGAFHALCFCDLVCSSDKFLEREELVQDISAALRL